MTSQSNYYSAVQKILSGVTCNTFKEFSMLRTDEERIKYVLSLESVQKAFSIKYKNSTKSATESRQLRDKGNACYQQQNYKEAQDFYTKSICVAPWENSPTQNYKSDNEELALAFGNRSATLYQLKQYRECIIDVDLAILHKYPQQLMYKLYDRKGRCLLALGNNAHARTYFEKVKEMLPMSNLTEKRRSSILENIEEQLSRKLVDKPKSAVKSSFSGRRMELPIIAGCRNVRFPNASQAFDVQHRRDKGRYVRSSEDVAVGQFLLVERPYASVISPKYYSERCYHCFERFEVPMPCSHCTTVRYCSDQCRVVSWDRYHEMECPFLSQLISSETGNISHLALRLVLVTGLRRLLGGCKSNPTIVYTDSNGKYRDGYAAIYNLVTNDDKRPTNSIFQYAILASFLVAILQKADFFIAAKEGNEHDETVHANDMSKQVVVGGILLRFLQIISCNGIEIMQTNISGSVDKSEQSSIGLALYTTTSLLNHSCDPNADLIFYRDVCAVRAIQRIGVSQEIQIDYGFLYYSTPRKDRQSNLKDQYFFDCDCTACMFNWDLKTALKSCVPPLKCARCWVPLMLESRPGEDPNAIKCIGCNTLKKPVLYFEELQASAVSAEQAYKDIKLWQFERAIPVFEKHITTMDRYVQQPWKEYITCLTALKSCYRLLGNVDGDIPKAMSE